MRNKRTTKNYVPTNISLLGTGGRVRMIKSIRSQDAFKIPASVMIMGTEGFRSMSPQAYDWMRCTSSMPSITSPARYAMSTVESTADF